MSEAKNEVAVAGLNLPSLGDEVKGIGSDFTGELRFCAASDQKCKSGDFPINHFALKKGKNYEDMDKTVHVMPVAMFPKALDVSGDEPVMSFKRGSEVFEDIAERSKVKDSNCMWGTEILVWIPKANEFATIFLKNPTLRNINDRFVMTYGKGATLTGTLIENKKHGDYHSMACDLYAGNGADLVTWDGEAALKRATDAFNAQKEKGINEYSELEGSEEEAPKKKSRNKRG
jgi:hypothetical protein